MPLPKSLTTVTRFSKILALILFIAFPYVGFFLGRYYQHMLDTIRIQSYQNNYSLHNTAKPDTKSTVNSSVYLQITQALLTQLSTWKPYVTKEYSFNYPPHWYIDNSGLRKPGCGCIYISDYKDFQTQQANSATHISILIGYQPGVMPQDYGWTNGVKTNPTIKDYSIHGYSGNWGETESSEGMLENVQLANPNGGWVRMQLSIPQSIVSDPTAVYVIFNEILSTFHFT